MNFYSNLDSKSRANTAKELYGGKSSQKNQGKNTISIKPNTSNMVNQ
jgi:hypothetical protein